MEMMEAAEFNAVVDEIFTRKLATQDLNRLRGISGSIATLAKSENYSQFIVLEVFSYGQCGDFLLILRHILDQETKYNGTARQKQPSMIFLTTLLITQGM